MKINVYYEDKNHVITLDVPDTECEIWIENDYRHRLSAAEDKSAVNRRTAQEIMDEDFNKPTFNRNQTETRRHTSLDVLDPENKHFSDDTDILRDLIQQEKYEELYAAIAQLKPKQQELLKKAFWEKVPLTEIAKSEGVDKSAISHRMTTICNRLKKILAEKK